MFIAIVATIIIWLANISMGIFLLFLSDISSYESIAISDLYPIFVSVALIAGGFIILYRSKPLLKLITNSIVTGVSALCLYFSLMAIEFPIKHGLDYYFELFGILSQLAMVAVGTIGIVSAAKKLRSNPE